MSVGGWSSFGAGGFGPSKMWKSLPYRGYKDRDPWVEQFIDAIGDQWDLIYNRFVSTQARANLLDPTRTPTEVADANYATATSPPVGSVSTDTMLDVLLYIAGVPWPIDTNLSTTQKQALVLAHVAAVKRKGNRQQLLNLASIIADGVAVGWTVPPFNFSIILPDGAPAPGYGPWVQASSSLAETNRPWILATIRNCLANITPSFINLGIGYSQFRDGYSSDGETGFPVGCRINVLTHEHFDAWGAGVPTGWTKAGTGTLTQSTSDASINWEFTGNAAVLDLTGAASGTTVGLSQTAANANNQYTHRLQLDYKYTNAQSVSVLTIQVTDANSDGNTYYWNPTTATWSTAAYSIPVAPSSSRGRFACDIVPQSASNTASVGGTSSLSVKVFATSDGTATTQTTYTLYRVGLYEKFSLAIEQSALGERSAWYPLIDAPGWTTANRAAVTGTIIEVANSTRTAYKVLPTTTAAAFPYHPALSGRGYRASSAWTNLVKGSNDFGADWTLSAATKTANTTVSPAIGDGGTAPTLTKTGTSGFIYNVIGGTPNNKSYVGGIWIKKLSADNNFTDVTLKLLGTTSFSTTYNVTQAQGWVLLPFSANFGADAGTFVFELHWGAASSNGQIAVADAYVYDVTGKTGVLYPPIIRSAAGSTGTLTATKCQAISASQGVNVLHPLLQRNLASVVRGSLGLTIVPTFDAASQPSGVIFDLAKGAAADRVVLRVNAGALELKRWDDAGNTWTASLTLSQSLSPASTAMTWQRDKAITVHAFWDENSTMLSAGGGNVTGTKPGSWSPLDTLVSSLTVGEDYTHAGANCFDGIIKGVELIQLGAPVS